jgi:putative membrane protein
MGGLLGMGNVSPTQQAAEVSANVRSDADIMGAMHQSNMGEISAGNLAQGRASDQAVRDFAAMMVRDHTTLDQQGMQLGQRLGISPVENSRLAEILQTEMAALTGAGTGSSFDRMYMASQVIDHQRTLALVDAAIGMAQRPELRTMLRDQVRPPVAMHLQQAQSIQARVGMP